jgi:hypothetical protein
MRRLRSSLAGVLALVLVVGVAGTARAEAGFIPKAVTIAVDDDAKTITATVNIAFYNRSCSPGQSCDVPAADVTRIVKAIMTMWNNGSKVKCYEFKVIVNAHAVGSQSEAGQTEVDVGLDYGPVAVRAFVHGQHAGSAPPDHLSNSPDQRVEPAHDPSAPTTWPSQTYDQTYAHEFGHILGLDDNYDSNHFGFPLPGASDDLMFRKQGEVTGEMVTRVVERSGQVDVKKLKCGWTFNGDTPLGQHRGLKCDGLGGDWTIQGLDVLAGAGQVTSLWNVTINEATLAGSYKHERIQTLTGSVTTSNASGKARIVLNTDGSVLMYLDAAPITLKTVTIVGTKSVVIPGQAIKYPWESDTGGACP